MRVCEVFAPSVTDMTQGKIRTFVAIEISDALKERMREIQSLIGEGVRGVTLPKHDACHLTVKFIGDIDEDAVPDITGALTAACDGVRPFTLVADGVGGFPSLRSPRVVWVGVDEHEALAALHADIEEGLARLGIEKETIKYKPHVTLCRVRSITESQELSRIIQEARPSVRIEFPVTDVVFFKSVLTPKGAVHTPLARIGLNSGVRS